MPGPTDTEFFERADMLDTKVGADPKKADPADVAKVGYRAMLKGEGDVVAGFKNKLQAADGGGDAAEHPGRAAPQDGRTGLGDVVMSTPPPPGSQPGGLEAPLPPSADPTKKTTHTSDPQADDPGNGAD
jgi:hypothetical protein